MTPNVWVKLAIYCDAKCVGQNPGFWAVLRDGCPDMYTPMGALRVEEGGGEFYLLC
ncbi:MAG: hypothetical protein HUJ25_00115 [Crocinitomicaceae bacterium]|nr:hypothetical protein [Crocinitomicaceae bacterium]